MVYLYYRLHSGISMSENFGIAIGALGFTILWRGTVDKNLWLVAFGIFSTTLALNARAVHLRAIGAAEIDQHIGRAGGTNLGVLAADVGIGDRHRALGQATNGDYLLAERDPFAAG